MCQHDPHCGSGIVQGDERKIGAQLRDMGKDRGVDVQIAHDGMEVVPTWRKCPHPSFYTRQGCMARQSVRSKRLFMRRQVRWREKIH